MTDLIQDMAHAEENAFDRLSPALRSTFNNAPVKLSVLATMRDPRIVSAKKRMGDVQLSRFILDTFCSSG